MKQDILDRLELFNDPDFIFDPVPHTYTYHGKKFTSVTRFISQFHKPFEQDFWSKRKAEQMGVTQEEMLKKWQDLNDYANVIGTATHQWIEDYFNQIWTPLPNDMDIIKRINKFNDVFAQYLYKLEPVKFEVRIFSKKWNIAGMIDSIFLYKGKIFILDWKTNKFFSDDSNVKFKEMMLPPFDKYIKTHLNEYSIQISLYSLILEEWGFEVGGGYLVHIGPDDEPAKIHKVVDMRNELRSFLDIF